jgi:hypothetical protein
MSDAVLPPVEFTTGFAPLPDIGSLEYNNVTFSSLFGSKLEWVVEQANDSRVAKWVKITIEAAGIVTLGANARTIDTQMLTIRRNLAQDAGVLKYTGRGFGSADMVINQPGGRKDLNWGPKVETLSFEPLGQGLSAMVHWRVTTWVSEVRQPGGANVVQFNNEVSIAIDEDFYTGFVIKGTLEIGLTRVNATTRTLTTTVDNLRQQWLTFVANSIDLRFFRVIKRTFNVSRDRRILEWEFAAAELPAGVVMPASAPNARGSFRFQPKDKDKLGLISWICSLRCTYTIDRRYPRRMAWFHFALMLWYRMTHSRIFGLIPSGGAGPTAAQIAVSQRNAAQLLENVRSPAFTVAQATTQMESFLRVVSLLTRGFTAATASTALLINITGEEGLYLDGKTVTLEAQWRLFSDLDKILLATGFQRYLKPQAVAADRRYRGSNNTWAVSLQNVAGWQSWAPLGLDPAGSAIIDFGSVGPPDNLIVNG